MIRIITALLLVLFAAGLALEACSSSGSPRSTPAGEQPDGQPTLIAPDTSGEGPSHTIEVPPPID